jgi:hypothetical protein
MSKTWWKRFHNWSREKRSLSFPIGYLLGWVVISAILSLWEHKVVFSIGGLTGGLVGLVLARWYFGETSKKGKSEVSLAPPPT